MSSFCGWNFFHVFVPSLIDCRALLRFCFVSFLQLSCARAARLRLKSGRAASIRRSPSRHAAPWTFGCKVLPRAFEPTTRTHFPNKTLQLQKLLQRNRMNLSISQTNSEAYYRNPTKTCVVVSVVFDTGIHAHFVDQSQTEWQGNTVSFPHF